MQADQRVERRRRRQQVRDRRRRAARGSRPAGAPATAATAPNVVGHRLAELAQRRGRRPRWPVVRPTGAPAKLLQAAVGRHAASASCAHQRVAVGHRLAQILVGAERDEGAVGRSRRRRPGRSRSRRRPARNVAMRSSMRARTSAGGTPRGQVGPAAGQAAQMDEVERRAVAEAGEIGARAVGVDRRAQRRQALEAEDGVVEVAVAGAVAEAAVRVVAGSRRKRADEIGRLTAAASAPAARPAAFRASNSLHQPFSSMSLKILPTMRRSRPLSARLLEHGQRADRLLLVGVEQARGSDPRRSSASEPARAAPRASSLVVAPPGGEERGVRLVVLALGALDADRQRQRRAQRGDVVGRVGAGQVVEVVADLVGDAERLAVLREDVAHVLARRRRARRRRAARPRRPARSCGGRCRAPAARSAASARAPSSSSAPWPSVSVRWPSAAARSISTLRRGRRVDRRRAGDSPRRAGSRRRSARPARRARRAASARRSASRRRPRCRRGSATPCGSTRRRPRRGGASSAIGASRIVAQRLVGARGQERPPALAGLRSASRGRCGSVSSVGRAQQAIERRRRRTSPRTSRRMPSRSSR